MLLRLRKRRASRAAETIRNVDRSGAEDHERALGNGSGTVQQVLDSITEKPLLAYNSVLTTIRVLERKGYLKHLKDGRAHVYTPVVGQQEATRSEIRHLVSRFFKNSEEQLVLNLLEDQGLEAEEIGRLRQMLTQKDVIQKDSTQKSAIGSDGK